jgi:hypothetical protein
MAKKTVKNDESAPVEKKTYKGIATGDFIIEGVRAYFGKEFKTPNKATYDLLIKTKRIK